MHRPPEAAAPPHECPTSCALVHERATHVSRPLAVFQFSKGTTQCVVPSQWACPEPRRDTTKWHSCAAQSIDGTPQGGTPARALTKKLDLRIRSVHEAETGPTLAFRTASTSVQRRTYAGSAESRRRSSSGPSDLGQIFGSDPRPVLRDPLPVFYQQPQRAAPRPRCADIPLACFKPQRTQKGQLDKSPSSRRLEP